VLTALSPREVIGLTVSARRGRRWRTRSTHAVQVPAGWRSLPLVDAHLVAAAHDAGCVVHVWTIDDPVEMGRLLDLGVDGIMTDRPTLLREVLELRAQWNGG
jgi:glycerophosphoryl diester phosphodiesterase